MKKLLTMMLMLVAGTAMSFAAKTVYFAPNDNWKGASARFALYMYTDGENNAWADFEYDSALGVYKADYNETYTGGIVICRMDPANVENKWDNKWNQSADIKTVPTKDTYYAMAADADWDKWSPAVTRTKPATCVLAGQWGITNNFESWVSTSSNNVMSVKDELTFTVTVTEAYMEKDVNYDYKFVEDGVYIPGDNKTVSVAADGQYSIEYTWNWATCTATATPTLGSAGEVETKYFLQQYLGGDSWDGMDEMTVATEGEHAGKKASWTFTRDFTTGIADVKYIFNKYIYFKDSRVDASEVIIKKNNEASDPDGYCFSATPTNAYKYSMTVNLWFSDNSSWVDWKRVYDDGMYIIGGTGDWTIGQKMAVAGSTYSIELPYTTNYSFALISNEHITETGVPDDWKNVIRPESQTNFSFEEVSGNTIAGDGSQNWKMTDETSGFKVTFTYNQSDNSWNAVGYTKFKLGPTGYATYSNAKKYKVSGATANFVTVAGNVATLVPQATDAILPEGSGKNNGIILSGTADAEVTITAARKLSTAVDASANLLAGSGNDDYDITGDFGGGDTYTGYIFANDTKGVGFYKLDPTYKTLAAHKAFLAVPSGGAPEFIAFGGDATGIEAVEMAESMKNAEFYNLAGQRVAQPTKGLYIVNGKKVIVK